jgi:hypothetical protein
MRTEEQKFATKLRKAEERARHRERVFKKHPPSVRYAKSKFKKGTKRPRKNRKPVTVKLGVQ